MNAKTIPYAPSLSVVAQIGQLPQLEMLAIRALWKKLFGGDTPTYNRQFMERRIAYKLQSIEFRKIDRNLLESNQHRIQTLIDNGKLRKRDKDYRPPTGSVLTRLYQDIEHRVVVEADGQYEYEGRRYGSLSIIAREITGTRWSGPLFFGLKQAKTDKKPKGARK